MRRADRITRPRTSLLIWIGTAAFLVGCAAEAPPATGGELSAEDRAAIQTAWDGLAAADLDADWATSESYLTDDFVHMDPREPGPIQGIAAWREWVESMGFEDIDDGDAGYEVLEIGGGGEVAYVIWTLSGSWVERGQQVTTSGKGLSVYRKQADGSWLLARNAWNEDPS